MVKEKASSYLIVKPGLLFGPKRPMSLLLMFFFQNDPTITYSSISH